MYFKPLAFEYPGDSMAENVEDQLMLGNLLLMQTCSAPSAASSVIISPYKLGNTITLKSLHLFGSNNFPSVALIISQWQVQVKH